MFILFLIMLTGPHQGQRVEYQQRFDTPGACVEARVQVKAKILQDNPTVSEKTFDKNFILLCEKAKDKE